MCGMIGVPRELTTLVRDIAEAWIGEDEVPTHQSYAALASESLRQCNLITDSFNCRVRPVPVSEPYRDYNDMWSDIMLCEQLLVSSVAPQASPAHPLFQPTTIDRTLTTVNTAFRAAHDFFGHFFAEAPFNGEDTFMGEVAAWRSHRQATFAAAHSALFSETIGQLCYYAVYNTHPPVQRPVILPSRLELQFVELTRRTF